MSNWSSECIFPQVSLQVDAEAEYQDPVLVPSTVPSVIIPNLVLVQEEKTTDTAGSADVNCPYARSISNASYEYGEASGETQSFNFAEDSENSQSAINSASNYNTELGFSSSEFCEHFTTANFDISSHNVETESGTHESIFTNNLRSQVPQQNNANCELLIASLDQPSQFQSIIRVNEEVRSGLTNTLSPVICLNNGLPNLGAAYVLDEADDENDSNSGDSVNSYLEPSSNVPSAVLDVFSSALNDSGASNNSTMDQSAPSDSLMEHSNSNESATASDIHIELSNSVTEGNSNQIDDKIDKISSCSMEICDSDDSKKLNAQNVTDITEPMILANKYLIKCSVDSSTSQAVYIRNQRPVHIKNVSPRTAHEVCAQSALLSNTNVARIPIEVITSTCGKQAWLVLPPHFGDLHSHVRLKRRLKEAEAQRLFSQVAATVEKCHSVGLVLRDLKLRKFVFTDFNRHRVVLESVEDSMVSGDSDLLHDKHGCPAYVAPEILSASAYSGRYADMWGLGVILYTMLVGRYPFHNVDTSVLFGRIRSGKFFIPEWVSSRARHLILSLLRRQPDRRLTAKQVLLHPWLNRATRDHNGRDSQDHIVPKKQDRIVRSSSS